MIRRWIIAFLVGVAITLLPMLVSTLNYAALKPIGYVAVPGAIVALLLNAGNVHTYSVMVLLTANVILYATATYLLLKVCGK